VQPAECVLRNGAGESAFLSPVSLAAQCQLCRLLIPVHAAHRRAPEQTSECGISGGVGDKPRHSLLPEPALSGHGAHDCPGPHWIRKVVLSEFPDNEFTEICSLYIHLRSGWELPQHYAALRRRLSEGKRRTL